MNMKMKALLLMVVVTMALTLRFTVPSVRSSPAKSWTFMVYVDGDNNLEQYAIMNLNAMEEVGSTVNVDIVVQVDRIPGYDDTNGNWTEARRYHVVKDSNTKTIGSELVQSLGEVNMGDPNTLVSFTEWAIDNYPAQRYCLVLWDHGGGFWGVCWDDTSEDKLDMDELSLALHQVKAETGITLDVLAFDACLMSMVEVEYQLVGYARAIVASEETVPGYGFPYNTILNELVTAYTMDAYQLAQVCVEEYAQFYAESEPSATLSAVNESQLVNLFGAVDRLAIQLESGVPLYETEIRNSRRASEEYGDSLGFRSDFNFIDLYDFAYNVKNNVQEANIQSAATEVMNRVSGVVLVEWHAQRHPDSNGVAIFFPKRLYTTQYDSLAFSQAYHWDDFLRSLLVTIG